MTMLLMLVEISATMKNQATQAPLRPLLGKIKSRCVFSRLFCTYTCIQSLLFNLCARLDCVSILCIILLIPNPCHWRASIIIFILQVRKPVQRGDVWCPRASSKVNFRVLDSSWFSWHCKIKREDRSQALHPGRPLRVQLPKQRCGVSWSSLVHWLINLPGVHSRKGKVKDKGKTASSFFKEKKARPSPPPAWPFGGGWSGCLVASQPLFSLV